MYSGHSGAPGPTLLTTISNGAGFVCAMSGEGDPIKRSAATIAADIKTRIDASALAVSRSPPGPCKGQRRGKALLSWVAKARR
jgi:hypothetical protein